MCFQILVDNRELITSPFPSCRPWWSFCSRILWLHGMQSRKMQLSLWRRYWLQPVGTSSPHSKPPPLCLRSQQPSACSQQPLCFLQLHPRLARACCLTHNPFPHHLEARITATREKPLAAFIFPDLFCKYLKTSFSLFVFGLCDQLSTAASYDGFVCFANLSVICIHFSCLHWVSRAFQKCSRQG